MQIVLWGYTSSHCRIALWNRIVGLYCARSRGRIVQHALCGFHIAHSILAHHADPIMRILLYGFYCADSNVQIPLCVIPRAHSILFHRADSHHGDSIMEIPSWGFYRGDFIVQIPSCGFHRADSFHRVDSIVADSIVWIPLWWIPSCRFHRVDSLHRANCIVRIALCGFHPTPLCGFHCTHFILLHRVHYIVGLRCGIVLCKLHCSDWLHCADSIVLIPSNSIVQIQSCKLHLVDCIVRIA